MPDMNKRLRLAPAFLAVSVSVIALMVGGVGTRAEVSELDSFQLAATSQSEQDAIAFIKAYPSSHLIGDLFDLLSPDLAERVCTELGNEAPSRAQNACQTLQRATAVATVEPAAGPTPATGQLPEAAAPTIGGTSLSALPAYDNAISPMVIRRGGKGKDETIYWLLPTLPNTVPVPGDESRGDGGSSDDSAASNAGNAASNAATPAVVPLAATRATPSEVPLATQGMPLVVPLATRATPSVVLLETPVTRLEMLRAMQATRSAGLLGQWGMWLVTDTVALSSTYGRVYGAGAPALVSRDEFLYGYGIQFTRNNTSGGCPQTGPGVSDCQLGNFLK